ncbi:MAG: hypothetical protein ACJA13_003795, partial [Paraglaciecola sp.]
AADSAKAEVVISAPMVAPTLNKILFTRHPYLPNALYFLPQKHP